MWSSLPAEILWIIKDKLYIFDIASVNSVCHNWWFASKSYPQRQTVGDGIPWIVQPGINNTLEVRSVTRQKKIIIDLPEFYEGRTLFSKQGWVLIYLNNDNTRHTRWVTDQLLLLNPLTKARIKLPQYRREDNSMYFAFFSIDNGRPHRVVLYVMHINRPLTLSVAQVGDAVWTDYSYNWRRELWNLPLIGLLVIEPCIYCCHSYGKMIIYNVETQVWKEVREHGVELKSLFEYCDGQVIVSIFKPFYMDCDGKLVLYGTVSGNDRYYCYSDSDDTWKRLSDDFKIKKSIFNNVPNSFVRLVRHMTECLEVDSDSDAAAILADKEEIFTWVDIG